MNNAHVIFTGRPRIIFRVFLEGSDEDVILALEEANSMEAAYSRLLAIKFVHGIDKYHFNSRSIARHWNTWLKENGHDA